MYHKDRQLNSFDIGKSGGHAAFLLYYYFMIKDSSKLGAFIVPTGIGASIGGYAGDASVWARKFSCLAKLIVNPNVVNAGGFSGINDNMLYVEGYSLDSFFKGRVNLIESHANKIGVVFDRAVPQEVLNVHINTINAVKTVYGVDVAGYEITEKEIGIEFFIDKNGISTGAVTNPDTMTDSAKKLLAAGCRAIAIVGMFKDPEGDNEDYSNGVGVDPVGGVEAILSHYISRELKVPCAHSPAFEDLTIPAYIVNPKAASEYITPTFLPCVLLGLDKAPLLTENKEEGISVNDLDFLVMPYNALGSVPVFEALNRNIPVFAVRENSTELNVTNKNLFNFSSGIIECETYEDCYNLINSGNVLMS